MLEKTLESPLGLELQASDPAGLSVGVGHTQASVAFTSPCALVGHSPLYAAPVSQGCAETMTWPFHGPLTFRVSVRLLMHLLLPQHGLQAWAAEAVCFHSSFTTESTIFCQQNCRFLQPIPA